jgi:hypothetical protein
MQTSGGGGGVNDEFGPYAVPERAERFASSAPACSWPEGDGLAMTLHDEAFRLRADNDLSRIDWLYADSAA